MDPQLTRALAFGVAALWALEGACRLFLGPRKLSAFDAVAALSLIAFSVFLAFIWREARRSHENELKRVAATDTLTGLSCGTHLMHVLEAELDRAKRKKRPLGLLLIDIDYFAPYNHSHGFKQGDLVLASFGADINQSTRRYDTGFRYGHDEFVLILPETEKTQARLIAERLREAFYERWNGELSLSIGLAPYGEEDENGAEQLLNQATGALSEARRQGGNRCRSYIERGQS